MNSSDCTTSRAYVVPQTPTVTFKDYGNDYVHEDGENSGLINTRKRNHSIENWEREIKDGKLFIRPNHKDERYSNIFNPEGKAVALQCVFCNTFFKGPKPGGSTYKHLRRCETKANKNSAEINAEQKQEFLNHCFKLMCDNFMPTAQLNTPAFVGIIQNALKIGFDCAKLQPNCLPPKAKDLIFDRTTIVRKLERNVAENYENFRQKIREIAKKNSGTLVVDFTSKQHHYGMVLHVYDDNWDLKILPLDFQPLEEDVTGGNIFKRTEIVLNEYGLKIEDVAFKTGEESNILIGFKNVDSTFCTTHFLNTITKQMLNASARTVFVKDVKKTIKKVNAVIDKIKDVIDIVCRQPNLHSQLHLKLALDVETISMFELNLARQFLELTDDDLAILKTADEPLPTIITNLMDDKQLIVDFVNVMTKIEEILIPLQEEKRPTIQLVKPLFSKLESCLKELALNESEVIKSLTNCALAAWKTEIPKFSHDIFDVACFLDPNQLPNIPNYFDDETLDGMVDKFKFAVSKFEKPKEIHCANYALIKRIKRDCSDGQVVRYFQEGPSESIEDFDLNEWWKQHEDTYPAIAKLAKKILSIPASSVSVEKLFSHLNDKTLKKRSKLKDETMSNLVKFRIMKELE